MFYIETPDGLTVTETGRKTIFVPKDNPNYGEIIKNISHMTYNNIFDIVDIKAKVCKVINEKIECFFNEDEDLQIDLALEEDNSYLKNLTIKTIQEQFSEDEAKDIESLLAKLKVSKIKIIFE